MTGSGTSGGTVGGGVGKAVEGERGEKVSKEKDKAKRKNGLVTKLNKI
jgi:hypothetical protein